MGHTRDFPVNEMKHGVCCLCGKTFPKETESRTVRATMLHMAAVHSDELETMADIGWDYINSTGPGAGLNPKWSKGK